MKKSHKPLEKFMYSQQSFVSKISGFSFISLDSFAKEIDTTLQYALKLVRTCRVVGAQRVYFNDGPRWIIPAAHNYRRRRCLPKQSFTKDNFEEYLNEKGCPHGFVSKSSTGVKKYGGWLRINRKDEFNILYQEFVKDNAYTPEKNKVKKPYRHRRPSTEDLFPPG